MNRDGVRDMFRLASGKKRVGVFLSQSLGPYISCDEHRFHIHRGGVNLRSARGNSWLRPVCRTTAFLGYRAALWRLSRVLIVCVCPCVRRVSAPLRVISGETSWWRRGEPPPLNVITGGTLGPSSLPRSSPLRREGTPPRAGDGAPLNGETGFKALVAL